MGDERYRFPVVLKWCQVHLTREWDCVECGQSNGMGTDVCWDCGWGPVRFVSEQPELDLRKPSNVRSEATKNEVVD